MAAFGLVQGSTDRGVARLVPPMKLSVALGDRASFRRFCGFSTTEATPERTAFVRFRKQLRGLRLDKELFNEVTRQLKAKAVKVKTGTLVDATVSNSRYASAKIRSFETEGANACAVLKICLDEVFSDFWRSGSRCPTIAHAAPVATLAKCPPSHSNHIRGSHRQPLRHSETARIAVRCCFSSLSLLLGYRATVSCSFAGDVCNNAAACWSASGFLSIGIDYFLFTHSLITLRMEIACTH